MTDRWTGERDVRKRVRYASEFLGVVRQVVGERAPDLRGSVGQAVPGEQRVQLRLVAHLERVDQLPADSGQQLLRLHPCEHRAAGLEIEPEDQPCACRAGERLRLGRPRLREVVVDTRRALHLDDRPPGPVRAVASDPDHGHPAWCKVADQLREHRVDASRRSPLIRRDRVVLKRQAQIVRRYRRSLPAWQRRSPHRSRAPPRPRNTISRRKDHPGTCEAPPPSAQPPSGLNSWAQSETRI